MKTKSLLYFLVSFCCCVIFSRNAFAQYRLYEDRFQGGVTAGGYSPGTGTPGNGYFTIHVAPGSFIRKAYLTCGCQGPISSCTVTLNGNNIVFDTTTAYTFFYSIYGGAASVHAVDITSLINPLDSNYTLYFPGNSGSAMFTDFYMYVAYSNDFDDVINTEVYLNSAGFADTIPFHMRFPYPPMSNQIGLSLSTGFMCNVTSDGEFVYVNGTNIGKIGGADINSQTSCGGTMGSFYYEMDFLHGLNDDLPDLAMDSSDALSNIKTLVSPGDTAVDVVCIHDPGGNPMDNSIWVMTLAYSDKPTGINTIHKNEIKIFPNPAKDELHVTTGNDELSEILIYDVASRLLIDEKFTNSTLINLKELERGIYLYDLSNKNGVIKQGRIVKE